MNDSVKTYDVLIIGTGISGLSVALKTAEAGLKVGVITRGQSPQESNTFYAQGGIIYSENDDKLVEDIDKASAYTSNLNAAKILADRSASILKSVLLDKAKTDFDRDENGALRFTKEAAHSYERILYKGDYTGKEIQISLLNLLNDQEKYPNLEFLTAHTAVDLITAPHHGKDIKQRYEKNDILGAYVLNQKQSEVIKVLSKVTVLATGGVGSLYLHNSNSSGSRGDGHAMAKRAGAFVSNMEFIQFHPTTFYTGATHRRFLISEAVRGEGGKLVNSRGERFMHKYHSDAELAPRDIVSRAILSEMIDSKDDCVYLDITHKDESWLKERFPTIYSYCLEHGLDMTKKSIPVVPAAHYTCGGVKTDLNGRTNLGRLYAVGEVATTGLHGANRLASTSLLECLTFGTIAAENILENISQIELYASENIKDWKRGVEKVDLGLIYQDIQTIKQTMWNYLGLRRSRNRLARARAMFRELSDEIHKFYRNAELHDELIGLRNAVEVAFLVLNASVQNKESVGCFYREN